MTPQDFIRKWKPVALTERATAQEHFLDLCRLFDHPTPAEDDPTGERFTFEKGVSKTGGGDGFADVWKKGFFAWEYKKKKRDLDKALEQLTRYAAALENPPLHVACDTHLFRVETRWTNEVPAKYEFELDDLAEPENLAILQAVFFDPDKLRSGRTRAKLTKEAADKFQTISDSLQHRNPDREAVAHFLGGKLLRRGLGDETVEALFRVFEGRVPAEADLVCYWFVKAWQALQAGRAKRVGLVSTNSIRGGANRKVLEPIAEAGAIFEAWSDEPWTIDGAAVRVSLACFGEDEGDVRLDATHADRIHADLSAEISNLPTAQQLLENAHVAFMGDTKGGAFDIEGSLARAWLAEPLNANGRPNSDVLTPWINGLDLTRRCRDMWIVDFGWTMSEGEAALYEAPFSHVIEKVKPERDGNRRATYRDHWWRHVEPRPALWAALTSLSDRHGRARPDLPCLSDAQKVVDARHKAGYDELSCGARYVCTPRVAKHRLFVWLPTDVCPDSATIAIARADDTTFGILHSRFHEAWSLRLGTWLGVGNDPRYTPTTTFETFPFPAGLTPDIPAADYAADPRAQRIAAAAKTLDDLRRAWLNPPDLVDIVPEVTPTAAPGEPPRRYPDRILPKTVEAAAKLRERTLTNLYNERPRWLADAHEALDRAVAAAYGWPEDIATDDALQRLLALNLERAAAQRKSGDEGEAG
jgi:type II restriction/modification system DNA methylase subunit YeeA